MNRSDKIKLGAAKWCAFYRANPHRFVRDYLHVNLRLFQKIIIINMMLNNQVAFIASRGIGKTFLTAVYCVTRCILYPGTQICIASGTRGQAEEVLQKIQLILEPNSNELKCEIDQKKTKINGTNAIVVFKNSSFIKVVTSGESARGNRANVLVLDESRLIKKENINTILRKFLTQRRMPSYSKLSNKEKQLQYDKEKNQIMYLTSAYYVDHWMYTKCLDLCKFMINDKKKQFVCGLPYQLAIKEGIIDKDTVLDEMAESDFNEIKFMMEYEALFFGTDGEMFFDFNTVSKNRKILYPMLPSKYSEMLSNASQIRIPHKQPHEIRILSADVALMSSKKHKNDATSIFINQMVITKANKYMHNMVYTNNNEGLRTDEQALSIRKLFDEFECDYIVLDCQGIGLGVYDALARDIVDPETGEIYPAISCCNNKEMADRCTSPNAEKVIWAVKANAQFNSDCAFMLRDGLKSGRIRLLSNEYDADTYLSEIRGYKSLDANLKTLLKLPYINTTLLVNELVKLQHEESGVGKIKIKERAGMRKDRYSSLAYNYYVATQIESKYTKKNYYNSQPEDMFVIKAPNIRGRR